MANSSIFNLLSIIALLFSICHGQEFTLEPDIEVNAYSLPPTASPDGNSGMMIGIPIPAILLLCCCCYCCCKGSKKETVKVVTTTNEPSPQTIVITQNSNITSPLPPPPPVHAYFPPHAVPPPHFPPHAVPPPYDTHPYTQFRAQEQYTAGYETAPPASNYGTMH